MASNHSYIVKIAREFWSQSRTKFSAGSNIAGAVNLLLPIDIVSLSDLRLTNLNKWLTERQIFANVEADDRLLHGFILTHAGSAIMFINETDTEEERNYTIAHEASHFILDYKIPRDHAITRLGPRIAEVIDGYREPTLEERIDGLLSSVILQPYTHLLEKSGDGSFNSIITYDAEINADALALELLAPQDNVLKKLKTNKIKLTYLDFRESCYSVLTNYYRLPESIAIEYSGRLARRMVGSPSLLKKLGF